VEKPTTPAAGDRLIMPGAWVILGLVGGSILLFHFDRQMLSILKPEIARELQLSNAQYSFLLTAFMLPYTAAYLFTGRCVDRFGTRASMTWFIAGMSAAAVWCAQATSVNLLAVGRALLGVSEAGVASVVYVALARWFPPARRGLAFALKLPIQAIGLIGAPPIAAWIALHAGWRMAFLVPGAAGFLVAAAWALSDRRGPGHGDAPRSAPPVSLRAVLGERLLWGILLARLMSDPLWFFLQYWQASYFREHLGMPLADVGRLLWIPPFFEAVASIGAGWLSDRWVSAGATPVTARMRVLIGVTALAPCAFFLPWISSVSISLALVCGLQFMGSAWITLTSLAVVEIVPSGGRATAIGLISACGGVTAIIFNACAGTLIDRFGYTPLFMFGGLLHPASALLVWHFYLRPKTHFKTTSHSVAPVVSLLTPGA
jgi:ACS family hexuronate transporter-like MFS transporter